MLGHRPLQALRGGGRVERHAVPRDVAAVAHAGVLAQDEPQDLLALLQRHVDVRAAGTPRQVEGHEDERSALAGRLRLRARRQVRPGEAPAQARLQEAEVGPTVGVERDHLAIDDCLRRCEPRWRAQQLREVAPGVVPVARPKGDLPVGHDRLDTVAVPFRLEEPVVAVERGGPRRRQHRLDEGGPGERPRGGGIQGRQRRGRRVIGQRWGAPRPPRRWSGRS